MGGPKHTRIRPFTDEDGWLERFQERQRAATSKCCPRCQRGHIPGQFPCGRPGTCPNTDCHHSRS